MPIFADDAWAMVGGCLRQHAAARADQRDWPGAAATTHNNNAVLLQARDAAIYFQPDMHIESSMQCMDAASAQLRSSCASPAAAAASARALADIPALAI